MPRPLRWAMKYHRHLTFGHQEGDPVEDQLGEGDEAVYVTGDGWMRCMAGRLVGASPDGSTYCLVGSIDVGIYERYANDDEPLAGIFAEAEDLLLCAVYEAEDGPSNIADVQRYRHARDVPPEYLPPHPFIDFADELT